MPLYLHVLTELEYGLNDLMLICGSFFMILVTFRLNAAMLTVYYDYLEDEQKKKEYLRNTFSFSILIGCLMCVLFYFVGEPLFEMIFKAEEAKFFPYGFIVLCYAVIGEINSTYYIYMRNEKDLIGYFLVVGLQILTTIILQLIFVLCFDGGVAGLLFANLISNIIVFSVILLREEKIITFTFDGAMLKKSIRFSAALIPYLLIWWVLTKGGKFVLERHTDLTTIAIFAILVTLSSVVIIATEAVINGLRPFLFEIFTKSKNISDNKEVDLLTKMIVNIPLLIIPFIVLIGSNPQILTAKVAYLEVAEYLPFIVLTVFVLVYAKLFYQQLVYVKRSDVVTLLSFLVMLVLCIGFHYLVPTLKIWGVLYATLIANALMAVLFYIAAQRYLTINYSLRSIFLIPLIFFIGLFGMEFLSLHVLGVSRGLFGVLQFVVLTLLVLVLNWNWIRDYKSVFLKPS